MRVLITGITGSGGSYLAEYLVNNQDVEVHGISRWHSVHHNKNLKNIKDDVVIHECDLNDFSSVLRTLNRVKPDYIFHLAAHANVRLCFETPLSVLNNNVMGTANLFEAIHMSCLDPRVQLCGTSEVYGKVKKEDCPITELHPIQPANIYAVSKLTQEQIALAYYQSYGIRSIVTRMFSYINPRRQDIFSTSFATQVARLEKGQQDTIKHGNLDSVRTLIDVRDAMESYWIALIKGEPGQIYNIGGTTTMTVGEFLERLKDKSTASVMSTTLDQKLLRPVDVTMQIPDTTKFEKQTGWKPKYNIDDSINMLLDYCRSHYV